MAKRGRPAKKGDANGAKTPNARRKAVKPDLDSGGDHQETLQGGFGFRVINLNLQKCSLGSGSRIYIDLTTSRMKNALLLSPVHLKVVRVDKNLLEGVEGIQNFNPASLLKVIRDRTDYCEREGLTASYRKDIVDHVLEKLQNVA